jgi:hypothetical protein
MTVLYMNTGEEIEVLNQALVPVSVALSAGKEFLHSGERPRSVEWLEL